MCFQIAQLVNHLHTSLPVCCKCNMSAGVNCVSCNSVFFNFIEDNTFYLFSCYVQTSKEGDTLWSIGEICIFMKLIFTLLHCSSFVNSTCVGGCVTWDVAVADIELCMVQVPSVTKSFIIGAHKWHNRVRVIYCECRVTQCGLLLSRLDLCIL